MRSYTLFVFILMFSCRFALCQTINLSGENYLLLNGERFKNQKIVLTKAEGDWFATSKDGHGTMSFFGTYDGRKLRLDIEWDGKNGLHLVTDEIRHDGKRTAEFLMTMEDKAVYGDGLNAYPSGDDEMNIKITQVSELSVAGEMIGVITLSNEKVKVNGVFNLSRKEAQKKLANSSYKDCDNVVHDKLIGAEGRSPSECEAKFDLDVRTLISEAVAPVISKFQEDDWQIQSQTKLDPLFVVGRGSEKYIFSTQYNFRLQVAPTSATYAGYKKQMDDFTEKFKKVVESGKENKSVGEQYIKFIHEMYSAINVEVGVFVNNSGLSTGNYKGGAKVSKLSDHLFKIESPYNQARSGGGEDNSMDVTFLLIGSWKQPVVRKLDDGGEEIQASVILNPSASHLQSQNILIRIESNSAIANEVIKNLDLEKLKSLLNR
jgi:ribosomal protein S24E